MAEEKSPDENFSSPFRKLVIKMRLLLIDFLISRTNLPEPIDIRFRQAFYIPIAALTPALIFLSDFIFLCLVKSIAVTNDVNGTVRNNSHCPRNSSH